MAWDGRERKERVLEMEESHDGPVVLPGSWPEEGPNVRLPS